MHFNDIREAQRKEILESTEDNHEWEAKNCPLLHSGFSTGTSKDPQKGCLVMSLYFGEGCYMVRLQDKQQGERAFVEVGTLDKFLQTVEMKLKAGKVVWKNDAKFGSNGFGT